MAGDSVTLWPLTTYWPLLHKRGQLERRAGATAALPALMDVWGPGGSGCTTGFPRPWADTCTWLTKEHPPDHSPCPGEYAGLSASSARVEASRPQPLPKACSALASVLGPLEAQGLWSL